MTSSTFEMCRCCGAYDLSAPQKLIPFFGATKHRNLIRNIKNLLIRCWEIKIAEEDECPQHICPTCFAKLDAYFNMRVFCRKKQNQLNSLFKKMNLDRVEKGLLYEENEHRNNDDIKSKEFTNESLTCNKNQEAEAKIMALKSQENQNHDIELEGLKSIEFIEMPIKISKNQIESKEDSVAHRKMNASHELDPIEQSEYEKEISFLQNLDELEIQEIVKQLNSVQEISNDIQPVFDKSADNDFLEDSSYIDNETTISTENEGNLENNFDHTKTENKLTFRKLYKNPLDCRYCCYTYLNSISPKYVFKSKEDLNAHIQLQHDATCPYTCPICKNNYSTLDICRTHILNEHKNHKAICWICGVEIHYTYISNHIDRYHTKADYECEICGKKFKNTSLSVFNYHKRWHNKKMQHKCKVCGKIFVCANHLKVHMLVHTKDYFIKCDECGKGFRSKFDKRMHMYRIHGDALPVKCLYCEKRFSSYQNRLAHMTEMHGHVQKINDEKIKCLKCNRNFRRESDFRKHKSINCQIKIIRK